MSEKPVISPEIRRKIHEAFAAGGLLLAIREYRQATSLDLITAKQDVEDLLREPLGEQPRKYRRATESRDL
jgi:hypothetical protein